ncbi:MAG: DUF393 domain-containing protein [Planctomycetes bacterium]|nr:DUF393 domain-containing protein [Planctomycetota bacterium]
MKRLTILYDAQCAVCRFCRAWMEEQPAYLELVFYPRQALGAVERFAELQGRIAPDELVAVDDEGGVYRGDAAYLMCLYALEEYRAWSLRLAEPALRPLAARFFRVLAANRYRFSKWLAPRDAAVLETAYEQRGVPRSGPPAPSCPEC